MDKYICGIVFLVFFLTDVLGKSVNSPSVDSFKDIYDQPFSCKCEVSVENSTDITHDLGTVKVIMLKSDKDAAMHDVSHGGTSPCHALRHRCHKACVAAAGDLNQHIEPHVTQETLGFRLCMRRNQVTPHGGAKVFAHSSIHAPHCRFHGDKLTVSEAPSKVCCGHAFIAPEKDAQPVSAYGWNPDCHATRYVFGY